MSDEIVREFLVEGNENLDTLDRELVQLEKDPQNRATLASVFRTIHTIKGTCGFLGFTKLEAVAHVGENLLSRLRDLELLLNPDITTALLRMVDAVRQMMQSIEAIGNEGERNDEELIKMLTTVQQGGSLEEGPAAAPPAAANLPPHAVPSTNAKAAPPQSAAATLDKKHAQAPPPIEAPPQNVAAGEGDGTASGKSKAKKGAKIVPVETE
jgi:two-component system chemotaxis sensor kinase CheA